MSSRLRSRNTFPWRLKHAASSISDVLKNRNVYTVISETKIDLIGAVFLTTLFFIVTWFTQATFTETSSDTQHTGFWKALSSLGISSTLAILRILESILTTSVTFGLLKAFDVITWILTKRDSGVRTLLLLTLSSSTGIWGVLGLLFSKHAIALDRFTAVAKNILLFMIWASGILLFAKTELIQVHRTFTTYNITGGVGPFRGAYVSEFLDNLQATDPGDLIPLPYSVITTASQLIVNPAYSLVTTPVQACADGNRCNSYLLPGGLLLSTPWAPVTHEEYPTITIYNAPAVQLDFVRVVEQEETFDDSRDCMVFGSKEFVFGIQFCLVESQYTPNSLLAGIFICQNGVQDGKCQTSVNPPKLVTLITAYQRYATTTSARSNMSMLIAQDLTPPIQQVGLNVSALKQSFTWLFNSTAVGIPLPSSPAQYFWSLQKQLSEEFWLSEAYRLFHSLLAYPFWQFHDNNYGNIRLQAETITTSLPDEFKTYAGVDKPMSKILVDRAMFISFCVLQATCIIFIWVVLVCRWIFYHNMPDISSYPLIDFAMKARQQDDSSGNYTPVDNQSGTEKGISTSITPLSGDKHIRHVLKDSRTLLQSISKPRPDSGLTTTTVVADMDEDERQLLLQRLSQQSFVPAQRTPTPDRHIRRKPVSIDVTRLP